MKWFAGSTVNQLSCLLVLLSNKWFRLWLRVCVLIYVMHKLLFDSETNDWKTVISTWIYYACCSSCVNKKHFHAWNYCVNFSRSPVASSMQSVFFVYVFLGVLFTCHPVTGNPGQMVINANYGLGEVSFYLTNFVMWNVWYLNIRAHSFLS